jgi:hypothetical protein
MKAALVVLFLMGCFSLYYGGTMLLLVPGSPGEVFLNRDRILYGGIPLVVGVGAVMIAGQLWGRANSSGLRRRFGASAAVVVGTLVVVVGYGVLILLAIRRQP